MQEEFKSGIVSVVGRPNVGKSTLVNAFIAKDISIASIHPHTTRRQIKAIYNVDNCQIVFVDTPGIHKPYGALSERMNESAYESLVDVDVIVFVLDASAPIGKGDTYIAQRISNHKNVLVVLNKCDVLRGAEKISEVLKRAQELVPNSTAIIPVSAFTLKNIGMLRDEIISQLEEGPAYFSKEIISDLSDEQLVADMYREQLLHKLKQELPQSVVVMANEEEQLGEKRFFTVKIIVSKTSHKPIVIGKGGSMIEEVGTKARARLEKILGSKLILKAKVNVDEQWSSRDEILNSNYL